MTKEQYFHDVQYNQGNILYSMYTEKFDSSRHKPFLQFRDFMMYMQMSGMTSTYFQVACAHYEKKFGINKLFDKDGKLIAFT